jgi:hypothetical protein
MAFLMLLLAMFSGHANISSHGSNVRTPQFLRAFAAGTHTVTHDVRKVQSIAAYAA